MRKKQISALGQVIQKPHELELQSFCLANGSEKVAWYSQIRLYMHAG